MRKLEITHYKKQLIERMFFGPYNEEWLDERGRIDNSDETISARTQLPLQFITVFLNNIMEARNRTGQPIFIPVTIFRDYTIITLESKLNEEVEKREQNSYSNSLHNNMPWDSIMVSGILSLPT